MTSLVDCRWLGLGGVGRATELLLRGLNEIQPDGDWTLWGPEPIRAYAWPAATVLICEESPLRLMGQAASLRIPKHSRVLYLHQIRPLLNRHPSVTLIHDTIPLQYESRRVVRAVKRRYLRSVCERSAGVLTVSDHSARAIEIDLAASPDRLRTIDYPVDEQAVSRVLALREHGSGADGHLLYIGRVAPHKNIEGLVEAFSRTRFRAEDGRLVVVCGSRHEASNIQMLSRRFHVADHVDARWSVSQGDLDLLFARACALVQPSTAEGFGLPVWEARSCGLPRCVSAIEPLMSFAGADAVYFDPQSLDEMAEAVDEAVRAQWSAPLRDAPSVANYAAAVLEAFSTFAPAAASTRRVPKPRGLPSSEAQE